MEDKHCLSLSSLGFQNHQMPYDSVSQWSVSSSNQNISEHAWKIIFAIVLQNYFVSPVPLSSNNNSMEQSPPDVFINCTSPDEFRSDISSFNHLLVH